MHASIIISFWLQLKGILRLTITYDHNINFCWLFNIQCTGTEYLAVAPALRWEDRKSVLTVKTCGKSVKMATDMQDKCPALLKINSNSNQAKSSEAIQ